MISAAQIVDFNSQMKSPIFRIQLLFVEIKSFAPWHSKSLDALRVRRFVSREKNTFENFRVRETKCGNFVYSASSGQEIHVKIVESLSCRSYCVWKILIHKNKRFHQSEKKWKINERVKFLHLALVRVVDEPQHIQCRCVSEKRKKNLLYISLE